MALTPGVRLVAIGSPLVVVDDDTAAVAALLADGGIGLESRTVVDEDEAALERALTPPAPLTVLVTGPGGSAGDIARRVLARVTGARLVLSERMLAALEAPHRRVDRPLPRRDERLALLPQGAVVWARADGEPAWAFESDAGAWVVLPRGGLGPDLSARLLDLAHTRLDRGTCLAVRTLRTTGVTLGDVEERLAPWLGRGDGGSEIVVTMAPGDGEVWVRLRARGASTEAAAATLATLESPIVEALGEDCYGRDGESLEQVVGHRLTARGLTLATAESCTGGLVGHRLTTVPGSSNFFERGVVVYSNRAKQELLGVSEEILRTHGAVSRPCAEAMVRGVCERSGTACGLSITGIAGPDGGTPTKPVGTVFIGLAVPGLVEARHFRFAGGRASVKWQSSQMALDMLRRALGGSR
ncbi:MAG TPA: nicotinamide-nucleotide amidohydrolase family protein [Methylomirabilota bacterium]|jgi:PncC family amidohydrolase|nr:nicotinamide-nucleotide amidohydrolase family protein [Methylomirabilota bacterium]